MKTNLEVRVHRDGRVVYHEIVSNRVLSSGRVAMARLLGNAGGHPNVISIGTGTTAAEDTDEQLEAEVLRNVVTRCYGAASTAVYQLLVLATQANGCTISECGLWIGAHGDYSTAVTGIVDATATIFARALIPPFAKTSADTMVLTWEIPITSVKS
jgi:hypothetical protein